MPSGRQNVLALVRFRGYTGVKGAVMVIPLDDPMTVLVVLVLIGLLLSAVEERLDLRYVRHYFRRK